MFFILFKHFLAIIGRDIKGSSILSGKLLLIGKS